MSCLEELWKTENPAAALRSEDKQKIKNKK